MDHGGHYAFLSPSFRVAREELHINFQDVYRYILQRVKRGVAAPEIIHHHRESGLLQRQYGLAHDVGVVHVRALGKLEIEQPRRNVVFFYEIRYEAYEVRIIHVDARYVYRYRRGFQALVKPFAEHCADLFPHVIVDFSDKTVSFKYRNEHAGQ
ncbi:hypothetical protein SDC9_133477 [bioreactor metagenome]|uniref:Uncharacterized protein n=1 Tax=bioreactor metagenome TaxID=1076179 RepID=A0A645DBJ0_9ZZZZ